MKKIRLQNALAQAGIASRRKAATLIESGRVKVSGKVIKERGFRVDTSVDIIVFNSKSIACDAKMRYLILNKPAGIISTANDEHGRKTVLDCVKTKPPGFHAVGRLDKDTTGLMILTNDGELTYRLTHPKFQVDRVYEAKAKGRISAGSIERLMSGIAIDGKTARAEKITVLHMGANSTFLNITMREGRKREVRKMLKTVGHRVLELKRLAYGPLKLGSLEIGRSRDLTEREVKDLKKCVGLR
ncbi:MAG: pseudouridine synthase [Candidatus Omnitrophota bacterium]